MRSASYKSIHWFSGKNLASHSVRLERGLEDMRQALINCDTQFLQLGNMEKGEKGLAEENPGQQDHEQKAGVGMVIPSHSFLGCSQAPKLACVSPQVLANYFT